jgi:transcriptional regulator with XRE-family HTH domain
MAASTPAPLLAAFGVAVRQLRVNRGLTQERLAEAAGIHRTYIGDVERGLRNVSLVNIVRIAKALSIEASTLLAAMEKSRRS